MGEGRDSTSRERPHGIVGIFAVVQFQAVYAIVRKRQRVDRQAAERDYTG